MEINDTENLEASGVEKIAATLRKAIFEGYFLAGEQLKGVALSRSLGVSRGSVREALRILTTEGLVVHLPNKGASVRKLSTEEIDDIFLTRQILEVRAAQSITTAPDHLIQALVDSMKGYEGVAYSDDLVTIANAHINFHKAFVGLTGSLKLVELEESLMQALQVIIACIENDRDDLHNEIARHNNLTDMVVARNEAAAVEWINNDIPHGKEFVVEHLASQRKKPRLGR